MHLMKQKGDQYTKVFSTLSEVILMCCVLAQLNILCGSVIKPYFTKIATCNILDLIEVEQSIHHNVQYFT